MISISVCFDLVLWHINYFRLFNAKSALYIICKYFVDKLFKQACTYFLLFSVKWFQGFLSNTDDSIYY